jgi:CDP-diacylglycerol--serine O-phosphatidyltransferase
MQLQVSRRRGRDNEDRGRSSAPVCHHARRPAGRRPSGIHHMPLSRTLRYLAPNLVTTLGVVFGLLSLVATFEGRYVDAAWLIIWSVMIDRLDGLVARSLRATSEFGLHMDSFADAINFGVAPAYLAFVLLGKLPVLGFTDGFGHLLLMVAVLGWVIACIVRLAKFNAIAEEVPGMFFGVATTLAAGVLTIWMLVLLKYSPPALGLASPDAFTDPRLLGDLVIPVQAWGYVPAAMIVLALLMVSNAPMPKLAPLGSRGLTAFVLVNVVLGYLCAFTRYLPEFMAWMPTSWLLCFLVWGQISPRTRGLRPPPIFPR